MTRVLVFDGVKAAKRFELCRIAVLAGGDGKGERTRDVIRKEARLLDALDAVSTPAPTPEDPAARAVVIPQTVSISQDDYQLLEKYLDTCPWLPRTARDAVDVQDWISAAEKIE
jgi:hypothetical protein